MLFRSTQPDTDNISSLTAVELFHTCAANREDANTWSEFLRRYSAKLKQFIRGILRHFPGSFSGALETTTLGGSQESDLFQNIIVRLVENDCAAMKRFSGTTEEELLAYLAVISRSVVMDTIRRSRAVKRKPTADYEGMYPISVSSGKGFVDQELERGILTRELIGMAHQYISSNSGKAIDRDRLVFQLHFLEGLSLQQIAQCRGINLTKGGVEKLIKRVVSRVQTLATTGKPEATLP